MKVLEEIRDFGFVRADSEEPYPDTPLIHCEICKWGIAEYRECREIWLDFMAKLKGMGYQKIASIIDDDDDKLLKFQQRFGMVEVARANDKIVLTQEI